MEKCCSICKTIKPISDFYLKKGKPDYLCKKCHLIKCKAYALKNKDKINLLAKEWAKNNKEKTKKNKTKWRLKNETYHKKYRDEYHILNPDYQKNHYWKNPEKARLKSKKFRKENPKYNQYYTANKLKTDINFRIAYNMRHRILYALKNANSKKTTKTAKLLGCSTIELKNYLESKFLPTMSWNNYGNYWHIDHILPCTSFDLTKIEEQEKCFHYTNLQPLFAVTQTINGIEYLGNFNKGNRLY